MAAKKVIRKSTAAKPTPKTAAKKVVAKGLSATKPKGGRATLVIVNPTPAGDAEFETVAGYAGPLGWLLACRTHDAERIDVDRYNSRFHARGPTSKERLLVLLDALDSLAVFTMVGVPTDLDWARLGRAARLLRGESETRHGRLYHALEIVAAGIRFRKKVKYVEHSVRSDLAYCDPLFEQMPLDKLRQLIMDANDVPGGRGKRGPKFVLATIITITKAIGGGTFDKVRLAITSAESAFKNKP